MSIEFNRLNRVVGKLFDTFESFLQTHESSDRVKDFGSIRFPVGACNDVDTVFFQERHILLSIDWCKVVCSWASAWAHQSGDADVLIVPVGDDGHAGQSLCGSLRMTYIGNFFDTSEVLDGLDIGRRVIDTEFDLVNFPELFIVDSVDVVLLRILSTRVIGQEDVEAHLGELSVHWLLFINGREPARSCSAHTMLQDHRILRNLYGTVGVSSYMEHSGGVAIFCMHLH